ncbi:MAG: YraN family protein [Aeriscardovia aeriphila]|nr:YraN family protein [Aeriscardovia aeriphila]
MITFPETFIQPHSCTNDCLPALPASSLHIDMNVTQQCLGALGESLAARHLMHDGWKIIARNFRTRYGELDLIALEPHNQLVFIEVKTRRANRSAEFGYPEEAVTRTKQIHLRRAESVWLSTHPLTFFSPEVRNDVVSITVFPDRIALRHLRGAF